MLKIDVKSFWIIFLLLFLFGCSTENTVKEDSNKSERLEETVSKEEIEEQEPLVRTEEITVSAIGDILIHDRVYNDAETKNGYDFFPMLTEVKSYLENSTITFANQETMIGGVEHGLSGYPTFNSPVEVGDALKEIGVDIVSLANNHTLDRGEAVIQSAISHWETIDMAYVGSYSSESDRNEKRIIETEEGITVGFLAYTYVTNGIPVPKGKDYLVNLIDKEIISEDIEAIRDEVDVTIISLHFGNEYERMPSEEQKDLVQFIANQGVHVVLGHHPHVLQPIEWVTGTEDNETLVVYSLGNFLSGQKELYQRIGGILTFSIEKTTTGDEDMVSVKLPQFLPTYNFDSNEQDYQVLLLSEVTDDILPDAAKHYEEIKEHMSQWMSELQFVE